MASVGFLTREQVRGFDRNAIDNLGVPSAVLMENAGRGAAELLISLGIHGPVLVCCGKGNNGGDGLVIARHLSLYGIKAEVWRSANTEELSPDAPDAKIQQQILATKALLEECNRSEWVIDALFGTGLIGPVRTPFAQIIDAINMSTARVFAVDIPSGLNCDTGEPMGATIRAEHTVTFVAPKIGFANPQSREWTGKVHVVPIGIPRD